MHRQHSKNNNGAQAQSSADRLFELFVGSLHASLLEALS